MVVVFDVSSNLVTFQAPSPTSDHSLLISVMIALVTGRSHAPGSRYPAPSSFSSPTPWVTLCKSETGRSLAYLLILSQ